MSRGTKLFLDLLMGAVIPILILTYLSDPLGAVPAYVVSALVPAGWVIADLLFITKRFNFITSLLGLGAITRGLLAFWFVDGALFAFKDTVGSILITAIFAGSLVFGRPLIGALATQSLNPRTPEQEKALDDLFGERPVFRALWRSTAVLVAVFVLTSIANFLLNLFIVVAEFGTDDFNTQVARVNAITRFALSVPEMIAVGVAIYLVYNALDAVLPRSDSVPDNDRFGKFWELVELREKQKQVRATNYGVSEGSEPQEK